MTGFRFHDSLSREVREFTTTEPGVVRMYNCGPTVYGKQHLGNYRSYTCWDVLRRALELGGFQVRQIVNITDVGHLTVDDVADAQGEDKMELASHRERLDAWGVAKKYTDYFFDVARKLNWREAERYPRATDHVGEMIEHIAELIRRGHAYATPAGNVYFEVATFPEYGKLSGNRVEALDAGARVEVLDEKRAPEDFALWKRDPKHQMQWDSPWGRGFPGWHIECSAMSRKYLGDHLDVHTGGEDNAFPHHECEIAQSEPVVGAPFSRFWLHTRHLLIDGQKMSKSKGTMHVIEDVEARYGVQDDPARARQVHRSLRYYLLSTHYRAPMNFTWEGLDAARSVVDGLDAMVRTLATDPDVPDRPQTADACDELWDAFLGALQDDLNISAALSALHEFRTFVNKRGPFSASDMRRVAARIAEVDSVLGLGLVDVRSVTLPDGTKAWSGVDRPVESADPEIERLVAERQAARKAKDFARADAIRRELDARGVVLEDTPQGVRWYRR
jgi:cysteinyl-tRNA synthetase